MGRHPSDSRLERWVGGRRTLFVSSHVQHCPQCQERLEDLTTLEGELLQRLTDDLASPDEVARKVRDRMERAFADRETMSLLTDLLSNGVRTSRVLLDGDREELEEEDEHGG
jgi:hypothetical protein